MADRPRLLVLIGSGELAAPMARVQRSVVRRLRDAAAAADRRPPRGAIIDTPYAFQENAAATSAELLDFHVRRLRLPTTGCSIGPGIDARATEHALVALRDADYVFSGPGSPSYALRHWSGSALPALVEAKLAQGGAIVFASAAALTLGRVTLPVYEIYKAGQDPHWLAGLDVLSRIGINAAVVPHYDNAEGSGHDTRYCFVGERRLRALEDLLPGGTFILGVDEHTALVIDVGASSARVEGRGVVTLRRAGKSRALASGTEVALADLRAPGAPRRSSAAMAGATAVTAGEAGLVGRLLDVRREAEALGQRAQLVEPLVQALLDVRQRARSKGDWQTADGIRERLADLGIEVADAADGSSSTDHRLSRPS
jgi:hypothetical protein